ncbi:hopanoid biosynthesis associated RND transporter like protein HpnN [Bradyrhizobium elkanii USDA 61]|uniref:Hopanoid biosynthesis associated RND transporter like protein HpnN n=1 Tax=Bradyrhizobium elkanii TaxID=29448 RepID=A0A8I1YMG6_BRAEL|nr:hopanoid biosynthesis associated RND transporter like protein HpnN [Bradyrhizobium elkanii]MCS4006470.1 hopanoid biosynthesis associated RND transporter like protein HpnN [Bradyrhizobium elkanii USDA 61]MCP1930202.1 hopanoid biosynthesis associated RND transporter like protein HpnN [Bradyrhizobium elkanii]MCS3481540.1 hopanoid biosynthesis associated RND transporter like protein HpnN [Bradyrhizobium elkanii]MCS3579182.1 hopanoid biosynthesis associated RND transporter like protein HpnN [Brad
MIFSVLLSIGAGFYTARNFSINTDINKLISPDLDWRKRDNQFEEAFDRERLILAVVEAATPELTSSAAKALTAKLQADKKNFEAITALGSGEFFEKNGLLFLPTEEVGKVAGQLESAAPLIEIMAGDPSIRGLTGALETGLAGVKRGQVKLDNAAPPFNLISETVETVLAKGDATFSWRELTSDKPLTDSDKRAFIEIKPIIDYSALEPGKAATDAIRQAAADLKFPTEYHARVRLTGPVPIANEEYATVQDGAITNGIGTVVIVLVILWMALHSGKIIFAVFVNLFIGLAITTAVGLMMVGSLNLLSIAFAVLFIGLGVDFGIQFSVRYRSERFKNDNLTLALENAARRSAVPLSLAAMATAAGFLCFLPTDYKGISELGKIAGAGMLVAFVTSITVLPALLDLLNPPGEKEPVGYAFLAPLDLFLEKHRVPIIVGTLLVTLAGLPLLHYMKFDFNPINLRNSKVESIATFLDLRKDPNTGANAINVMTRSEADAKKIEAKLEKLPEVSRVMSLDSFVPDDQPAKLKLIGQAAKTLGPALNPDSVDPAPSDQENVESLKSSVDSLRKTAGDGKGPGAVAARRLADALQKLAGSNQATRDKAQDVFVAPMKIVFDQLRNTLQAQTVTLQNLPPELVDSWKTKDGLMRVEVEPKGDPNDNDNLRRFADAVLAAEPTAIGGPVSILKSGDVIVKAFIHAGILALVTIGLLLWLTLRRVVDVLMTLVPLLVAGIVTLEICVLIGLPLNFANIVALPLLLGVGVAFKIYYVTAWRQGRTNLLQSSLTRAIFFSALTTATAFGSLWLSSHPGTASMGKLLALSLVTTLAAVLLFQPALMGKPREVKEEDIANDVT